MREKYESLSLVVLKDLAKARGIKGISAMKKSDLIERMLEEDEKDKADKPAPKKVYSVHAQTETEGKNAREKFAVRNRQKRGKISLLLPLMEQKLLRSQNRI